MIFPIVIVRHPKERLAKCSLEALRGRPTLSFHTAKSSWTMDATGHTLLGLSGPQISEADAKRPLLLLDATWALLPKLKSKLSGNPIARSLPKVPTAYPRKSKIFEDPADSLASVEALYLACKLMGHEDPSLLEFYRGKEAFLEGLSRLGL